MKLIITVDTEADNQWATGTPITMENIQVLPKFQELCQKYAFIPTYLLTYEVSDDPSAVVMFSKWQNEGRAEIGAHLHPWTNPPIFEYEKEQHLYPSSLSDADFKSKLVALTDKIEKNFGKRPTSYRAGRWGFKESHADILRQLGYKVDCSISPKINWAERKDKLSNFRGPDFRAYSPQPFYFSNGLLEVPVTILYTGIFHKEKNRLVEWFTMLPESFPKKVLQKIFFNKKWLRIFPKDKESNWINIYKSALKNNLPVLEFIIHSSELVAGESQYVKDQKTVDFVYNQLEEMFKYFKRQGLVGTTLSDFAGNFSL